MMVIIISFRRRVGFFTMRDKWRHCVAANVPLWKKQSIFFPFFMEKRCNFEGTRLFVSYFIAEWMYVCFFEIRDYLWLMTRISCEDKWQLDWIVFFFMRFFLKRNERDFFFNRGNFILNAKGVRGNQDVTLWSGIFWKVFIIVRVEVTSYLDEFICGFVWMGTGIRCDSIR